VGVTTGPIRGEVFRDAVLGGIVGVTTDPIRGEACRDADLGGTMDVTTGPICGEACHDADVGCGVAFRDADLGGTVGVTTGSYLAILRCDASMLVLGGDIVGETTDSLIMSLYSPCRWAIMHCVGSMPW